MLGSEFAISQILAAGVAKGSLTKSSSRFVRHRCDPVGGRGDFRRPLFDRTLGGREAVRKRPVRVERNGFREDLLGAGRTHRLCIATRSEEQSEGQSGHSEGCGRSDDAMITATDKVDARAEIASMRERHGFVTGVAEGLQKKLDAHKAQKQVSLRLRLIVHEIEASAEVAAVAFQDQQADPGDLSRLNLFR